MPKPSPVTAKVRENAFWVYGVIVGLVIQDAANRTSASVLGLQATAGHEWEWFPQIVRFLVVLFVIIRFFLGAVKHFSENYEQGGTTGEGDASEAAVVAQQRDYMYDFVLGLFHFVLFFVLTATIDFRQAPGWMFPSALGVILLYDMVWWRMTRHFSGTNRRVGYWSCLNLFTVVLIALAYLIVWAIKKDSQPLNREAIAYMPLLFVSVVDIAELVTGRGLIRERLIAWVDSLKGVFSHVPAD